MSGKILLTLFAAATFSLLSAQSAEEILNNYFKSIGGVEQWKALKTTKIAATLNVEGMKIPITIRTKSPNKRYVESEMQGMKIIQAYDGTTAWTINPMMGGAEAQKMAPEQADPFLNQSHFWGSELIDYQEKGYQLELLPEIQFKEGTECFAIKLTNEKAEEKLYYFDKEYFLPFMMESTVQNGQGAVPAVTNFGDYRELEGLLFPYAIEQIMEGSPSGMTITVQSIELNVELEDELFAFPEK